MRTNAAIILQARLGSTRLPGKALVSLGGTSIVVRCLKRLQMRLALPVVLATTERREDDALERVAEDAGFAVFRGPSDDVLTRFLNTARLLGVDVVVRATADNPAVDMDGPRRVLEAIERTGADHIDELQLPYGAAVEAVTTEALARAARVATDPSDREHVTTLLRRDGMRFNSKAIAAPVALRRPDLRLTIDTAGDLAFMRRVFRHLGNRPCEAPLTAIINACDALVGEAVAS